MKKTLSVLLALVLTLGLGVFASADITSADLLIGFVHISDPSDMGYTYNHDLGTKAMVEHFGLADNQVISKYNVPESQAAVETAINELIDAGCNMIFTTSFGFGDATLAAAKEHPEIEFSHATGYYASFSDVPNFHNYFADVYEARYLAGIAAGLKTTSNKLGYVAAFPFAEVISGFSGFYLGAKSVNPAVEMTVMYTNSWNDPTVEAQVAKALIDLGCDVISQHSDSTAPATTAEQYGVFQVGYNADMIPAAPGASLISARIDWSKYLIFAVTNFLAGQTWGTDWCQGLADEAVFLSPLNDAIAAPGTAEAIATAHAAILAGTLNVFAGPLTDATGAVVVADGDVFVEPFSAPSWEFILEGITNIL